MDPHRTCGVQTSKRTWKEVDSFPFRYKAGLGRTSPATEKNMLQMELETQNIPREYLLKMIENEINTGFVFVAAARKAYANAKFSEANAALAKAEALHSQASDIAHGSQVQQIRAVTHQLSELRAAIDWLLTGFEPK